jgi:hypothetical protein
VISTICRDGCCFVLASPTGQTVGSMSTSPNHERSERAQPPGWDMLKRAGFANVISIMKYVCFERLLAIK